MIIAAEFDGAELARLDHLAAKRGVTRTKLLRQAVDAMLAQEALSGGFLRPTRAPELPLPVD